MPASVTPARISSLVRTTDSETTVTANSAAHRYMISTLLRCECPMFSSRWCRCFLSGANGDCPALARLATASSRSAYGMMKIAAGSRIGRMVGNLFSVFFRMLGSSVAVLEIGP